MPHKEPKFVTTWKKRKDDWYDWSISIEANQQELDQVGHVEYILHPTFKDRVRVMKNKDNRFLLEGSAYDQFNIIANVYFKDEDEANIIVPLKKT